MGGIYRFLKSTIVGGLVVLVPLAVLGAVVGWAVGAALKVAFPLFEWLPDTSVGGLSLTVLAAVGSVVAFCFLAGLLAETAIMRRLRNRQSNSPCLSRDTH